MKSTSTLPILTILLLLVLTRLVEAQGRNVRAATLTLNGFERNQDGGGPAACDGRFHDNNAMIVALPTPFFEKGKRCFKDIVIQGNGRTVSAKVVDECGGGCGDNIVDASEGVWRGLNVKNKKDMGELAVTWFDA